MRPTREPPTEAGCYLHRYDDDDKWELIEYGPRFDLGPLRGHWLGPFSLDDVAGMLEGEDDG